VIVAMVGDIVLDRFIRQIHQASDRRLDRIAGAERGPRLGLSGAGLEIVDRSALTQPLAETLHVADERLVAGRFGMGEEVSEGAADQFLFGATLDRLEARDDPGLSRERCEKTLRKGVDRLDLQATRAVEHAREQLASAFAGPGIGGLAEMVEI